MTAQIVAVVLGGRSGRLPRPAHGGPDRITCPGLCGRPDAPPVPERRRQRPTLVADASPRPTVNADVETTAATSRCRPSGPRRQRPSLLNTGRRTGACRTSSGGAQAARPELASPGCRIGRGRQLDDDSLLAASLADRPFGPSSGSAGLCAGPERADPVRSGSDRPENRGQG